jgi:hypothetical protein
MLKVVSTTMVALTLATGVLAESATMSRPIQAGSLHEGPLDMVAYWVPLEDTGFEVTATFIGRMAGDQPMRIVMKLEEGDDVAFSMPGYRTALYRFARGNDAVDVSVTSTGNVVAAN